MADLDREIHDLAAESRPLAVELLREAIRIPADYVDRSPQEGGDPDCGLSNHEGPRLDYLRRRIVELGAVDEPEDIRYDDFGNLHWHIEDREDGVPAEEKTVVYLDGHTDTVKALRERWHEAAPGIDPYLGLTDPRRIDSERLRRELGYLPPEDEWRHLIWGRGSADQLAGVVTQIFATRLLRRLRPRGALRGAVVHSYATVAEEDNDGGGAMFYMREGLRGGGPERIPDVVVLTEPTGSAADGALGIYRGQRGRMQIEVEVTGKSCHGSMPWEGRNPLELGAAIVLEAAEAYREGRGFGDDPFLGPGSRTASWSRLDTPSDCAVPERFTFRLDRRLTVDEDPDRALADVETLPSVARARREGLEVEVRCPQYDRPTWTGYLPANPQIYPGWVTPEDHPAVAAAVESYRRVVTPAVPADQPGGGLRREPRIGRWTFSTDGVGVPLGPDHDPVRVPPGKHWVRAGRFRHPAMLGLGAGTEENTHKIGEFVDAREMVLAIAFLTRFVALYRAPERPG